MFKNTFNYLVKFISSKWFIALTFALFLVQGFFFSFSIAKFIPADEVHHYGLSQYFSQQQLTAGPFISNQSEESFYLGDIERDPSTFYHYLMGHILRASEGVVQDESILIFVLRIINVLFGALALLVFLRIVRQLTPSRNVGNLSVFGLSLTGMFVWGASAVSYDTLAILFFFLFLYCIVNIVKYKKYNYYLYALFAGLATGITKYTFIPTILIGMIVTIIISLKEQRPKQIAQKFTRQVKKSNTFGTVLFSIATLLLAVWAFNIHFMNLIEYRSIDPKCDQVHDFHLCLKNNVFKRNYIQKTGYEQQKKNDIAGEQAIIYDPLGFTGSWLEDMYTRLYFFFGHKTMEPSSKIRLVFGAIVLMSILLICFKRKQILSDKSRQVIAIVSLSYILILYMYNLNTWISLGAKFAYQGRYLLPVIGFIYLFVFLVMREYFLVNRSKSIKLIITAIMIVALIAFMPIIVFLKNTDNSWYSKSYIDAREYLIKK